MFDDLKDKNNDQETTRDAALQSTPPAVLPVSSEIKQNSPQQPTQSKNVSVVEDMLADSGEDKGNIPSAEAVDMPVHSKDHTSAAPVTPAIPPMVPPVMTGIPDVSDDPMTWSDNSASTAGKKKMLIAGIIVIVIILLGIGGYVAYQRFIVQQPNIPIDVSEDSEVDANSGIDEADNGDVLVIEDSTPEDLGDTNDAGLPIDSDGDGLTDREELEYNTDPELADTDRDGLFDREEVVSWKTDPLNPDSDGDSFLDGDEVKNGYDPLGPGKLEFFDQLNF